MSCGESFGDINILCEQHSFSVLGIEWLQTDFRSWQHPGVLDLPLETHLHRTNDVYDGQVRDSCGGQNGWSKEKQQARGQQ